MAEANMAKRKASEIDLFDETVTVVVGTGSTQKSFPLHKGLLSHYSEYFDTVLKGSFAEAHSGRIDLPEEEVEVFKDFVLWLYGKPIQTDPGPKHRSCYLRYCELWVFGDRRQIPELTNSMIDRFASAIRKEKKSLTGVMKYIYKNTTSNAELRRFAVDVTVDCGATDVFREGNRKNWPADAVYDIMIKVWSLRQYKQKLYSPFSTFNLSAYYQNKSDEPASKGDREKSTGIVLCSETGNGTDTSMSS